MSLSSPLTNSSPHEPTSLSSIYIKSSSPSADSMDSIDLEAQTPSPSRRKSSHPPSIHAPYSDLGRIPSQPESPVCDDLKTHASLEEPRVDGDVGEDNKERTGQPEPEWKPWKLDEPYRVKMPTSQTTMEDWVKVMEASDDGMCKGWRDQIDTLIIFAGLFSATITAFTVESYKWLEETPADTLARLQLRALLNATHDPAIDRLAPAMFNVSASSVLINTLWFASLTLALAAVVVSILCKQWLYEYQRYDNFTTKESFLIRGLRYRGLQAWRVPTIIASLPILLQTALVLFLVGILILLGPLQTIVASITTAIVGLMFIFLGMTTILPAIQYVYPRFHTQCAYKSSQSWSFLVISAFWLFDSSMFKTWGTFDRWEVTRISTGMGHTLSSFLADTSLKPTIYADFDLLSDFLDGLDTSRRDLVIRAIPKEMQPKSHSADVQRIEQLRCYIDQYHKSSRAMKLAFKTGAYFRSSYDAYHPELDTDVDHTYHLRVQMALSAFLGSDIHCSNSNPAVFNRYAEHWARCTDHAIVDMKQANAGDSWLMSGFIWPRHVGAWDTDTASHFVQMYSQMLKTDQFPIGSVPHLSRVYTTLMESYRQRNFNPPPFILLEDIRDWIGRMPESESALLKKIGGVGPVLQQLIFRQRMFTVLSPASNFLEKQYLESFALFYSDFLGEKTS